MKFNQEPRYKTRRHVTGAIAAAAITGAVAPVALPAVASGIAHNQQTRDHRFKEYDTFTNPDIANTYRQKGIDPSSVTAYTIQPGDTASELLDTVLRPVAGEYGDVHDELNAQAGPDNELRAGASVVIPGDQLKHASENK